uniref:Uncharacterized protein n=1 Tax=Cyclophora tenuis TaxID=216820 RepID=A0A7S1DC13_CYCTE
MSEKQGEEVNTLTAQREAYEKRSTECILEHVAEVDVLKEKNEALVAEVASLTTKLEEQRSACLTLKDEITNLKVAKRKPQPIPVSPPRQARRASVSPGSSPNSGRTSVRALAACFEGKPPVVPGDTMSMQYSRTPDDEHTSYDASELRRYLAAEIEKNEGLERKLHAQSQVVGELRGEIASLTATRSAIQAMSRKEYERQTQLDQDEIGKLKEQLETVRGELEAESSQVNDLKKEILDLTSDRLSYEESIMKSYEQRSALARKHLDVEVNRLKMALTEEQMKNSKLEKEYESRVQELQKTIEEVNEECDRELESRQATLDVVQQKLDEHIDEVRRLEAERQQLCVTMNSMSGTRREELDELQADLMAKTAACTDLSRQVQSLEMQVENHKQHTDELKALRNRVSELESQATPRGSNVHIQKMEFDEMKFENKKLRDQVRNVTLERRALQEKLNSVVAEKSSGRSVQVLRDRNEKLKREVERLNKRLEKLEGNVTRIAI